MKKSTVRITILLILVIVGVVGYYAYLSSKSIETQQEAKITPVEEALSRDLVNDYPATPKEVLKYYNEILKCFYNEDCTDEEINQLGLKARDLYDEDLLAINPIGTYTMKLKADIKEYKDNKRKMTSSVVAASTNVFYFEEDGFSFARLGCGYTIYDGSGTYPSNQMYLLRRDANKKWKIYGWKDVENLATVD